MADRIKWCHICETGTPSTPEGAQFKELEKVLPPGYAHLLCLVEEKEKNRMVLKVRISSREDVDKWLTDFQLSSTLTWRKARTYPESGKYNTYRVDLRCQHKTYCSGPKDTNCPATLSLVLKRSMDDRKSRSTDRHMGEGYLLYVNWRNNHNHLLNCANVLSKRDVSAATVERLTELFQQGHSPSSALQTIKYDLQEEEGENYFLVAADRSIVPDLQFCYRLYHKILAKSYGAPSGDNMIADLRARIDHINQEHGVKCEEMSVVDGQLLDAEASASSSGTSTSETGVLERRLDDFVGKLKRKLREDETYSAPVKAFLDTFEKLHTDSGVQSALFSIGKPPQAQAKGRIRPRGFLQTSTTIGVQPTAVVRRKAALGERRSLGAGRPPKSSRKEHEYSRQGRGKHAAPHSLSHCVQESSAL